MGRGGRVNQVLGVTVRLPAGVGADGTAQTRPPGTRGGTGGGPGRGIAGNGLVNVVNRVTPMVAAVRGTGGRDAGTPVGRGSDGSAPASPAVARCGADVPAPPAAGFSRPGPRDPPGPPSTIIDATAAAATATAVAARTGTAREPRGCPGPAASAVLATVNSRWPAVRGSAAKSSTRARAPDGSVSTGSSAKTRAADTLRGRLGPHTGHSAACLSTHSRTCGVTVPAQPRITSARSGQARLPRLTTISAPRARSRSRLARSSNARASGADMPSTWPMSTSCRQVSSSASVSAASMPDTACHAISRESASGWLGRAGGSSASVAGTGRCRRHSVLASA